MYNAFTHLWYNSEVAFTSMLIVLCTIIFVDVINRLPLPFFIHLQHHCRSQTSFQATEVSHCALTFVWDVTETICWKMCIIYSTCTYSVAWLSKSADEKWKSAEDQSRKSETACENKITKKRHIGNQCICCNVIILLYERSK